MLKNGLWLGALEPRLEQWYTIYADSSLNAWFSKQMQRYFVMSSELPFPLYNGLCYRY
eukprot:SAG31_NODE_26250_length_445_cov_1.867052_1_plen_58_part_00